MRSGLVAIVLLAACSKDTNEKLIASHKATIDDTRARMVKAAEAVAASATLPLCEPGAHKLTLGTDVEIVLIPWLVGSDPDATAPSELPSMSDRSNVKMFLRDTDPKRLRDFLDDTPDASFRQALEVAPNLSNVLVLSEPTLEVVQVTLVDAKLVKPICARKVIRAQKLIETFVTIDKYGVRGRPFKAEDETGRAARKTAAALDAAMKESFGVAFEVVGS
jgi:hypothetical protein